MSGSRVIRLAVTILLSAGALITAAPQAADAQALECGYGATPSLAHARQNFKILDYACAAQELKAFLALKSLSSQTRADAHVLLGAVLYAQLEGQKSRRDRVLAEFVEAFRSYRHWRGDAYFTTPEYRELLEEAKVLVDDERAAAAAKSAERSPSSRPSAASRQAVGAPLGQRVFRPWAIAFGLGASIPMGNFSEVADPGLVLGFDLGYYTSPQFAVGVEVNPHAFKGSDDLVLATQMVTGDPRADAKWSETQISAYGKYLFSTGGTSPYAKFQAGIYRLQAKVTAYGVEGTAAGSDFGFAGGGGVQFKSAGAFGGFVETVFHDVVSEGTSTTFFDVRAGVVLFMGS